MPVNLERKLKAIEWECHRDMPDIKKLNGQGLWYTFPRMKKSPVKSSTKIPLFSFKSARGPPNKISNCKFQMLNFKHQIPKEEFANFRLHLLYA